MARDGIATESLTDMLIGYNDCNAESRGGDLTIPKLLDATSPKVSEGADGTSAGSLIPNDGDDLFLDLAGPGGPSPGETGLPYIEQRGAGGIVIDWSSAGDGKGDDAGVIAIITPAEHGAEGIGAADEAGIVINWSSTGAGKGDDAGVIAIITPAEHDVAGIGAADEVGIIINWSTAGDGGHEAFPTETIHPLDVVHGFDLMF